MALIEYKYWKGEPLKVVINFDNNLKYTVYTDKRDGLIILYIKHFSLSEGILELIIELVSNKVNLIIYDENDNLL